MTQNALMHRYRITFPNTNPVTAYGETIGDAVRNAVGFFFPHEHITVYPLKNDRYLVKWGSDSQEVEIVKESL